MDLRKRILLIIMTATGIIFFGDVSAPRITILSPSASDSVSYDQSKLLILSVEKQSVPNLLVSTQWNVLRYMDVSPVASKKSFPRDFYKLFDPKATIGQLIYRYKTGNGYTSPETLSYVYRDTMTIRTLWSTPSLTKFAQETQPTEVLGVELSVTGWKDSLYEPVYDDPNADGRALYKLHIQLVSGVNRIYLGTATGKDAAVEYYADFRPEFKPTEERRHHFHNSTLEQSCTTCHEGLPSADSGATMKVDCATCHKGFAAAEFLHAPVQMKECGSCHAWSADKKMLVAVKATPELCYDCHAEKKESVENSAFPHPVASECLTCHSAHGTNNKHQLKTDVYTLCSSCHPDMTVNHPVGKHPVRFAKNEVNGEEVSCVSCHNPHGSANDHLLKVGGGRMMICLECHQK